MMTKPTKITPNGFTPVPPELEAINFLQHLEKFTNNREYRAQLAGEVLLVAVAPS
jgi:hypothetical protein